MRQSRSTLWRLIGACLTLWCVSSLPVHAQFDTAVVLGTVRDGSGAVVPGATITLKSVDTGITAETQTDENGNYQFFNVRIGAPMRSARPCQGFSPSVVEERRRRRQRPPARRPQPAGRRRSPTKSS